VAQVNHSGQALGSGVDWLHQISSQARKAGDPVRRGPSAQALTPLEYWITRFRGWWQPRCGSLRDSMCSGSMWRN